MAEHQRRRVRRICQTCSNTFLARPYSPGSGRGRFCSLRCASKAKPHPSTKVKQTCQICNTVFMVTECEVKRGAKFCSRECYRRSMRLPVDRQFLERLDTKSGTDCILWIGNQSVMGYGLLASQDNGRKRLVLAHRFAFEMAYGPIPPGMQVLHRCDADYPAGNITYRRCVNPLHLFMGDHADNMADKVAKGRQRKGEGCHLAKLTEKQVRSIRSSYAAGGVTQKQLAIEHDISLSAVIGIIKRRSWKHID